MASQLTLPLRILVVEDNPDTRRLMVSVLAAEGHESYLASDGQTALTLADQCRAQVVLLDQMLPGLNAMECLAALLKADAKRLVVLIAGSDEARKAVAALHSGAFDYLVRPFNSDELVHAVNRASQRLAMDETSRRSRTLPAQRQSAEDFLTQDQRMREVLQQADQVAQSELTVLITGESGTGKEVLARHIQRLSGRADRPFVIVHCASLSEQLLESELFGHVKGAFTGAYHHHQGYVEAAEGGTLFLDEIGDISQSLQLKLLRVLQERQYARVGDTALRRAEFRLLTATNKNLEQLVRTGVLREDFYYRVNVFGIHMPPLRERPADILFLFNRFVRELAVKMGRSTVDSESLKLHPGVREALIRHVWPGNVRELRNVAERMVILSDGVGLVPDHLPEELQTLARPFRQDRSTPVQFQEARRQFEIRFLMEQLEKNQGNVAATARQVGMHHVALRKKLVRLGIDARALRPSSAHSSSARPSSP